MLPFVDQMLAKSPKSKSSTQGQKQTCKKFSGIIHLTIFRLCPDNIKVPKIVISIIIHSEKLVVKIMIQSHFYSEYEKGLGKTAGFCKIQENCAKSHFLVLCIIACVVAKISKICTHKT